ncbi:PREDICTED: melanoma-associated antigen B16-like [Chrysochloris asiatica]|uniref:Melanoma-associated antigen B16-like n=1 Tax=Chrysochloris asiatica TaxID=185453 RepID=A0A9B0TYM0_CHRAS|nr:PREDICTED: melanoma-associated antigen B16-like [Chrysochloris asiatica]
MSERQENPSYPHDESLQACSKAQGLEEAPLSDASKEIFLPSSSVTSGTLKEATSAEASSTTQCSERVSLSSTVIKISMIKSDDRFSSPKVQSLSIVQPGTDNLRSSPRDEKVALLMEFLLLKFRIKEMATKEDMMKMVMIEHDDSFSEIFSIASERMELVFGIDVMPMVPTSNSYSLFNKLGITYDGMLSSNDGMPKNGLLIFILGVIFMKGNRATEEDIWKVLNRVGIFSGQKHLIYGEPKKFITKDLVLEMYLQYRQSPNKGGSSYEFRWGPRAHIEINKVKFLEFLARINDIDSPIYSTRYEEALRDEEKRVRILRRVTTTIRIRVPSSRDKPQSSSHP